MPRPNLSDRVGAIIDAATTVLADRGYRRALMADIAAQAQVSPGALYRYVESKDALLLLLFTYDINKKLTLPVPSPSRRDLIDAIAIRLAAVGDTPRLDAALATEQPSTRVRAELQGILTERYDVVAQHWRLLAVVERSALDLPELFDLYFRAGRRHLTGKLATYLERRMISGQLQRTADVHVTARFIEESLTWFAWHRHGDPDSNDITEEAARSTAIDMNMNALLSGPK